MSYTFPLRPSLAWRRRHHPLSAALALAVMGVAALTASPGNAGVATSRGAGSRGLVDQNQLLATFPASPATLGPIPDGISSPVGGGCPYPGPPRIVEIPVSGLPGVVESVSVTMTATHAWVGDVVAVLTAPTGESHLLFGYTGLWSLTGTGDRSDLAGSYTFNDTATASWWAEAARAGDAEPLAPGSYRTCERGGLLTTTGADTVMNQAFFGIGAEGTWELELVDVCPGDTGSVSGASLTITTEAPPVSGNDAYSTTLDTPLVVPAPGVLANDDNQTAGYLMARLVTGPVGGTLSLGADGGFTYTPNPGFVGTDTFTYRAVNDDALGNVATVLILIQPPAPVQPPSNLRVDTVSGNTVTLRWDVLEAGPPPTGFVLEGGVNPGEVLASIPTGSTVPILTFDAPTGSFFVRLHTLSGTIRSAASNEVPLHVNVPVAPSAPAGLTSVVSGTSIGLSWQNTFLGGAPTNLTLEVSGTISTAVPLGPTSSATFGNVPPGTYTMRVRPGNAAGPGPTSDPVAIQVPAECSGAPSPPRNVLAYHAGTRVFVLWDPPASGPAPLGYVVNVTGDFTGSVQTTGRSVSGEIRPGTYTVRVVARNTCGSSAASPAQVVTVP
jgi:subtilisin-like proprotein convertase family protein